MLRRNTRLFLAFIFSFLFSSFLSGQGVASAQPPVQGCTDESVAYFYGFSIDPLGYLYRQTEAGHTTPPARFRLLQGRTNDLQVDIWEPHDENPTFRVSVYLVPEASLDAGHRYGFSAPRIDFQGLSWRHIVVEGRNLGEHFMTLDIGLVSDTNEYQPLCAFSFIVDFYVKPWPATASGVRVL